MERTPRRWTPEEVLDAFPGARLMGLNERARSVRLPESLAVAEDPDGLDWEDSAARMAPVDRAQLGMVWRDCINEPGSVAEAEFRTENQRGWRRSKVHLLNLLGQEDVAMVVCAVVDLGPTDPPPAPSTPTDSLDVAAYERPTWILQELDPAGTVIHTEGDVEDVFGRPPEDLEGEPVLQFLHPDDHPACLEMWMALLHEPGSTRTIRQRVARPDGVERWIESTVMNRLSADGNGVMLSLSHDITDRRSKERDLLEQALSDDLTGLPNRAAATAELQALLNSGTTTVGFIDLNGFKFVNDEWGHDVGDEVLAALGERLANAMPDDTLVARWGGDEFLVVAAGDCRFEVAAALESAISDPVAVRGHRWHASASIGFVLGDGADTPEELVRRADSRMYTNKAVANRRLGSQVVDPAASADRRRRTRRDPDGDGVRRV